MTPDHSRLSKISQPSMKGVFPRKDLFHRLDRERDRPIIWVSGPGGAGKTTLVGSYLADRQVPSLWYQVDAGDADPATFFYYLGLAGKKASPSRRKQFPLLTPEYLRGLGDFSRNFFSQLFDRLGTPTVLVLDDVQEVPDTALLHQCLLDGLSRAPAGLSLILISRFEPPAAYVRMRANRRMEVIGWNDLRLSYEEFEQAADCIGLHSRTQDALLSLHHLLDGWVAGLQLISRHNRVPESALEGKAPEAIFTYFANQFFEKVEPEVQECLLKSAFVSRMTPAMANRLSGNPQSGNILRELAHRNFFTIRRQGRMPIYEYHPLFQWFLQDTAEHKLDPSDCQRLKRRSAEVLLEESRAEEGVLLLASIRDWEFLTRQILDRARALWDQGRFRTLQSWVSYLPEEWVERRPWLLYWRAISLKPLDVDRSRDDFHKAYKLFQAQKDATGTYMSWAGAVETFIYLWGNFRLLDPWLDEFDKIRRIHPEFPSPDIRARVTYALFSALLWRKSNSPEMKVWSKRAEQLALETDNPTIKILIGSNLLKYFLWCCGDLAKADTFIEVIRKVNPKSVSPLARLLSKVMMATYHWFRNEMDSCLLMVNEGLEFANQTGIHLMDTALHAHAVYAFLMTGDLQQARYHLEKMGQLTNDRSHIDVAHYHYLCVWMQLQEGKTASALSHARLGVERIDAAGTRQARGFARFTLAVALCEMGEFAEAEHSLNQAQYYGRSMHNDYFASVYHICLALVCLRQGERQRAAALVGKGLSIARSREYPVLPWIGWYRSALTELLELALEQGREVEYASQIIRDHRLVPRTPPIGLENWPWPIRIYTFGTFEIYRDGQLLRAQGKVQQRPLTLLKALIALGGREIPEHRLVDALWPDAEGDAGHQALKTTLHRLRKLLGIAEAIAYSESRVSLNPRYCWIDTWALDGLLPTSRTDGLKREDISGYPKALAWYRGSFLDQEQPEVWATAPRERWRSRFLRTTELFARHLEETNQPDQAIDVYLRALEIDPHIELFYQRLMVCYARIGRPAAAITTYDRCRLILNKTLGLKPSPQTETLRQSVLLKK